MRDELKDRAISLLKDTYRQGYEDGVRATNVDCGVVWEERIDAIKEEIERVTLFGTAYIPIEHGLLMAIIDKHIGGDKE